MTPRGFTPKKRNGIILELAKKSEPTTQVHWKVKAYQTASPIQRSQMIYDLRQRVFNNNDSTPRLTSSDQEKLYFLIVQTPIKNLEDLLSLGMEAQWLKGLQLNEKQLMKLVGAVWSNPRVNPSLSVIQRRAHIDKIFKQNLK